MIEFRQVTKKYGRITALDDFSIAIEQNGIYCLLGRNGAGKMTLLKTLAGHIAATDGEVLVNGRTVSRLAMADEVFFVESTAAQFNLRLGDLFKAAADVNPTFDGAFALEMARRSGGFST
jgi:ABC-2 type transport system ATP-binding protein